MEGIARFFAKIQGVKNDWKNWQITVAYSLQKKLTE